MSTENEDTSESSDVEEIVKEEAKETETDDSQEERTETQGQKQTERRSKRRIEKRSWKEIDTDPEDNVKTKKINDIHFTVIEEGTIRGKPKLFTSDGYSYCIRDQKGERTHWTCSVRGKTKACSAKVIQVGDQFERKVTHNHPPDERKVHAGGMRYKTVKLKKPVCEIKRAARNMRKDALKPGSGKLVECSIVEGGTKRGRPMLFDADGFSYARRLKRSDATFWTCTIRRKTDRCPASMMQYGVGESASFVRGIHKHNHDANKTASKKAVELSLEVKKRVVAEPFKSAVQIVKEVYSQDDLKDETSSPLPKVTSMAHKASHFRRLILPEEPKNLDFELVESSIPPDFFMADVSVENFRHLVFASPPLLQVLSSAATWYVNESIFLVKHPFTHILTFSTFLILEGQKEVRQTPIVQCIMSNNREQDYKMVIEAVVSRLEGPKVEKIVAGFVKGLWKSLGAVLPHVPIQGCPYSFREGIQQKLKLMNLEEEYVTNQEFNGYVRKLKALPYLQADHVVAEFMFLRSQGEDASVRGLINFVDDMWILNTEWGVPKWTVIQTLVHTYDDCEAWRKRLSHRARCTRCHLYQLIRLLHNQVETVSPATCKVITDQEVRLSRRQNSKSFQAKLETIWDEYEATQTIDEITIKMSSHIV